MPAAPVRVFHFCLEGFADGYRRALRALRHEIPIVTVVSARRPTRGRRAELQRRLQRWFSPASRAVLYVADVNAAEFLALVRPCDVGIITIFDQVFAPHAIGAFRRLVNVHPSLLPCYRGPCPSEWVLRNGESHTGFTLHDVTERVDCGPIIYQQAIRIDGAVDAEHLNRRICKAAAPVVIEAVRAMTNGHRIPTARLDALAYYRNPRDYASRVTRS